MPIYDYRCLGCGHRFELRQSFQDPAAASCPQCAAASERVIHAPQIVYKAPGFSAYDERRNGFGNYWYNREAEEDATGVSSEITAETASLPEE